MQSTNFRTVEELLDFLPKEEREIVIVLRRLILSSLPQVKEKLSYQVPYYSGKSRICFIWPGSVAWGNSTFQGVQLGFCKGYLLDDEDRYLDRGNRKQVYTKTFRALKDMDTDLLRSYLWEAWEIDRMEGLNTPAN